MRVDRKADRQTDVMKGGRQTGRKGVGRMADM
jgi:hypothetical protein